jgi:hypothetical protein
MSGQPNPRPLKRHKADIDEWKILRKLKLGPCRVCEWTQSAYRPQPIELHHLVGRDLGGDDVPDNLVPLCRVDHRLVEERKPIACAQLRASLTLREFAYITTTKSVDWLNRYYPRRVEDVA